MSDSLPDGVTGEPKSAASLRRYPEGTRRDAIAAVDRRRLLNPRDRTIYREIAAEFQVGEQSLRLWVKKHDEEIIARAPERAGSGPAGETDATMRTPQDMQVELESLRRRIEQLQAENEVLKRAFVVFSSEWSK